MPAYSAEIAAAIRQYLNFQEWHYNFNEVNGLFEYGFTLQSKAKSCRVFILPRADDFLCKTVFPIAADAETRPAVMEFITRANGAVVFGNFDMRYERNGEISFRTFHKCGKEPPGQEIVAYTVNAGVTMFNRFGDSLLSVIFSGEAPEEAVAKAIGPT